MVVTSKTLGLGNPNIVAELATTGKIGNVSTRPRLNMSKVRSRLRFQEGEAGRSPGVRSFGQRDGRIPQKLSARNTHSDIASYVGHQIKSCPVPSRGKKSKEACVSAGRRLLPATVHSSVLAATRWITKLSRDLARVDKMGGRLGTSEVSEREKRRVVRGWAGSADWTDWMSEASGER